jgi:hypothetical protein
MTLELLALAGGCGTAEMDSVRPFPAWSGACCPAAGRDEEGIVNA